MATLSDGYESHATLEAGVRFSSMTPKRVTADVRIATLPQLLVSGGFMLLSADVDAAFVVPLGERAYATPRAGISLIGGAGRYGAGGAYGVNYGLGLVAPVNRPLACRLDFTHRSYLGDARFGIYTFSIGIAWLH